MGTLTKVTDLKAGDEINITATRSGEVIRVEIITPEPAAGLQHDDSLHGSGRQFARLHYSRIDSVAGRVESYKDVPLDTNFTVWW